MIPTFVCCSGIARMAFGVASIRCPRWPGLTMSKFVVAAARLPAGTSARAPQGAEVLTAVLLHPVRSPADTNDHLRLAGAQLADDLRNIVMVGLRWHAVNDLNFTPFSRQQAMNRLVASSAPTFLSVTSRIEVLPVSSGSRADEAPAPLMIVLCIVATRFSLVVID